MRTVDIETNSRLEALGYDGLGVVESTDNSTGEKWLEIRNQNFKKEHPGLKVCPTLDMVAGWIRDKFYINISILERYTCGGDFEYFEMWLQGSRTGSEVIYYETKNRKDYDLALEVAIKKALDVIEQKYEIQFKIGEVVMVRNDDTEEWKPKRFERYGPGFSGLYKTMYGDGHSYFRQCAKYDKDIVFTNKPVKK